MRAESTDVAMADLPAMPEDVAAAWASVLLDVHEKQSRQRVDDAADFVGDASQGQEDEHDD
jgi:hypothetical protein